MLLWRRRDRPDHLRDAAKIADRNGVRGEVTLEIAAIVARLDEAAIRGLYAAFALPGGREEFTALLDGLYRLDAETRAEIARRLKAGPRVVVVGGG